MRGGLASLALAIAFAGCSSAPRTGAAIRFRLPDLALPDAAIDVSELLGRVVVVHVFASWSLSAQADVEALNRVHDQHAAVVIGVGVDIDGATTLRPWQRGSGARYRIAVADGDVREGRSSLGAIDRVPTTIVVDRHGREARRHVGPLPPGALDRWIAALD